jgi:hypothetical protein
MLEQAHRNRYSKHPNGTASCLSRRVELSRVVPVSKLAATCRCTLRTAFGTPGEAGTSEILESFFRFWQVMDGMYYTT